MPDATPCPLPPDTSRFDAALNRANQYTHKAIEKPDIGGCFDKLANFVIEGLKDEGQ